MEELYIIHRTYTDHLPSCRLTILVLVENTGKYPRTVDNNVKSISELKWNEARKSIFCWRKRSNGEIVNIMV